MEGKEYGVWGGEKGGRGGVNLEHVEDIRAPRLRYYAIDLK